MHNYHYSLVSEYFYHPKKKLQTHSTVTPHFSLPIKSWQPLISSGSAHSRYHMSGIMQRRAFVFGFHRYLGSFSVCNVFVSQFLHYHLLLRLIDFFMVYCFVYFFSVYFLVIFLVVAMGIKIYNNLDWIITGLFSVVHRNTAIIQLHPNSCLHCHMPLHYVSINISL